MKTFLKNSLVLAWVFLVIRIYLSYTWLTNAESKLIFDFDITAMLEAQVNSGNLPSWWAEFMNLFVLQNTNLFEFLVTVGELSVGIALLIGIFTRFSAMMGALMNFSFLMTFQSSLDLRMLILHVLLVLFATSAGRIGLDRYIINFPSTVFKQLKKRFNSKRRGTYA
ncbi:DoxX family protein [Bacillus sp. 2205SS5-2]|uniref:DoxX family protein n=1 Tax=Bacillus sp. 2205SS5-2 TaxID=3109031 RepID=UPI003004515C